MILPAHRHTRAVPLTTHYTVEARTHPSCWMPRRVSGRNLLIKPHGHDKFASPNGSTNARRHAIVDTLVVGRRQRDTLSSADTSSGPNHLSRTTTGLNGRDATQSTGIGSVLTTVVGPGRAGRTVLAVHERVELDGSATSDRHPPHSMTRMMERQGIVRPGR